MFAVSRSPATPGTKLSKGEKHNPATNKARPTRGPAFQWLRVLGDDVDDPIADYCILGTYADRPANLRLGREPLQRMCSRRDMERSRARSGTVASRQAYLELGKLDDPRRMCAVFGLAGASRWRIVRLHPPLSSPIGNA